MQHAEILDNNIFLVYYIDNNFKTYEAFYMIELHYQ